LAVEDFTTYTEVDPNSHLSKTAYHVDHKAYRNEDCYLYKDKGAAHFGDFTHLINLKPISGGTNPYGGSYFWMLSNDIDDWKGLLDAFKTCIGVGCWNASGSAYPYVYPSENYSGTRYDGSNINLAWNTQYYCTLVKSGTSLTLHVYSDSQRTQEVSGSPQSITLHGNWTLQYIFAGNTYNTGTDTDRWIDVDVDNLDLQEGGAVVKEVVDSLSLSEALLRNETLAISDSVGLADTSLRGKIFQILDALNLTDIIFRGKTFTITDSMSLSEIIDVVTGAIVKYVADTIGLAEQIGVDRVFIVSDTMSILDLVFRHWPSVAIMDALVLAEGIAAAKTLAIADQMVLAEVVEKTVAGAVKTRIFLIVGDLAIQIVG
jgi:hypothetical protein